MFYLLFTKVMILRIVTLATMVATSVASCSILHSNCESTNANITTVVIFDLMSKTKIC